MNWKKHYTGIDILEAGWRWASIFAQRHSDTKKLCYFRLDFGSLYGFGWRNSYLLCNNVLGYMFWLNAYKHAPVSFRWLNCFGWLKSRGLQNTFFEVHVDRFGGWNWRVGRFFVGGRVPNLIQKWLDRRQESFYAKMADEYERMYKEENG